MYRAAKGSSAHPPSAGHSAATASPVRPARSLAAAGIVSLFAAYLCFEFWAGSRRVAAVNGGSHNGGHNDASHLPPSPTAAKRAEGDAGCVEWVGLRCSAEHPSEPVSFACDHPVSLLDHDLHTLAMARKPLPEKAYLAGHCVCGGGVQKGVSCADVHAMLAGWGHSPPLSFTCDDVCRARCAGWRQTGRCDPAGPREAARDASCAAVVRGDASGFCDCGGGRTEGWDCKHSAFSCDLACALGVAPQLRAGASAALAMLLTQQRAQQRRRAHGGGASHHADAVAEVESGVAEEQASPVFAESPRAREQEGALAGLLDKEGLHGRLGASVRHAQDPVVLKAQDEYILKNIEAAGK